jgi:hypothetical protein
VALGGDASDRRAALGLEPVDAHDVRAFAGEPHAAPAPMPRAQPVTITVFPAKRFGVK